MKSISLLAILAAVAVAPKIPATLTPSEIPNYTVIAPGLAGGGQPAAATIDRLRALGFKTVINLRTPAEGPAVSEEEAKVKAQGLRYISVPVAPATFSAADVAAVRRVIEDPKAAPILLHCHTANRVGAVWAAIQVGRGRTLAAAEAEGVKVGLRSGPMTDAFRRVASQGGGGTPGR